KGSFAAARGVTMRLIADRPPVATGFRPFATTRSDFEWWWVRVRIEFSKPLQANRLMYRVTQQIDFCYGHRLLNYDGKCKFLHGHNGRVVISMEGETLDERGMLADFTDIKRSLRGWINDALDHRMILHRDDPLL